MDKEMINKKLGVRLREIRLARGLKQEDLEGYDFCYRHYGKIERGISNPTLDTLIRLCEIFEIDISVLFSFMKNDDVFSEDKEAVAISICEILKQNDKEKIRKLRVFLDEIL